ncbi:MAG: hypothetical protein HYV48_01115 [Candidatus Omnitrophica bacterium]|nr:hypothetical protein [Candidatus Omnitrophota bacterium]
MTKRDILSIALKILGITSIMNAVFSIHSIGLGISMLLDRAKNPGTQDYNAYWFIGSTIVSLILWLIIAYILLRRGDLIAKKLIHDNAVIPLLGEHEWEKPVFILSIRIVGVVCLIRGIQQFVRFLPQLITSMERHNIGDIGTFAWGETISAIVLLVIGAYLLSGGRHLVEFAYREKQLK